MSAQVRVGLSRRRVRVRTGRVWAGSTFGGSRRRGMRDQGAKWTLTEAINGDQVVHSTAVSFYPPPKRGL